MKGVWLRGLAMAVLLGSATPPYALDYDLSRLVPHAAACTPPTRGCAVLGSRREALAEAERQRLERLAQLKAEAEAAAAAQAAIDRGLKLVVSIPEQMMYVFREGALITTSPVSTGKRGHATPAGTFQILQKKVRHRSNLYANAPMPYMQRLTFGGVALHAGHVPGYPASHGCIRLPSGFARKLFHMTDWTTRVTVTKSRPRSAAEALELI